MYSGGACWSISLRTLSRSRFCSSVKLKSIHELCGSDNSRVTQLRNFCGGVAKFPQYGFGMLTELWWGQRSGLALPPDPHCPAHRHHLAIAWMLKFVKQTEMPRLGIL